MHVLIEKQNLGSDYDKIENIDTENVTGRCYANKPAAL